jgi:ribulose-phosphate 3-epimerase
MPESLERIAALRSQLHQKTFVQVDGGVGEGNIAEIRRAGAQAVVAGSAIFDREDYPRAYRQLVKAFAEAV